MFLNRHYNSHVLAEPKNPVCRKQDEMDAKKQTEQGHLRPHGRILKTDAFIFGNFLLSGFNPP